MGYRGEDLDLRTPPNRGAPARAVGDAPDDAPLNGPRVRRSLLAYARVGPIWVDETVLDCCNHAFDVARALRAGEVGLEHLVHALTQIETAADILESRGIRVASVRRLAAAAIAADVPTDRSNGKGAPRRSDALEEILRLAAGMAYRRNTPVAVDDILQILAEHGSEFSGLEWLRPEIQRAHGYYAGEPRLQARAELTSASGGELPGVRIEALEQMVRTLRSEIADERKILTGVLHDLQREIMAQREDTSRFGGTHDKTQAVFSDRLQSFDEGMIGGRASAGADMSLLHERIGALERAVQTELSDTRSAIEAVAHKADSVDLTPLENKLAIIEEAVLSHDTPQKIDALSARLASVEQGQETVRAGTQESHSALATSFGSLTAATDDHHAGLAKDVASLTSTVEEHTRRAADGQASLSHDIGSVEDALGKVNDNQLTLAEQLGNLHKEVSQSVAASSDRLEVLERTTTRTLEMLEALSGTVGKIHDLAVEREYRRTRFWFWLFGTDDWIKASWPSQTARLAADLKRVKSIENVRSTKQ